MLIRTLKSKKSSYFHSDNEAFRRVALTSIVELDIDDIFTLRNRDKSDSVTGRLVKAQGQRVIDSGGGFLIEEDDDLEEQMVMLVNHALNFYSYSICCRKLITEEYTS